MRELNVSYATWKTKKDAHASWGVYYVTRSGGGYRAYTGHEGLALLSAVVETADIADFDANYKPGATLVVSEDDALALLGEYHEQPYDARGVPVSAPGKGATPDGKLWVSAVKMTS